MGELRRRGAADDKELPATVDKKLQIAKSLSEEENTFLSKLFLTGDISKLNDSQQWEYYKGVCHHLTLDPYTLPFELMKGMGGKIQLYAKKGCAELLARKFKVTVKLPKKYKDEDGTYIVEALVTTPDGRETDATGVVFIGTMSGDNLANAKMKAETKAHRRGVLRHLGLGMLDETEVEDIPNAEKMSIKVMDEASKETPKARTPRVTKESEAPASESGAKPEPELEATEVEAEEAEEISTVTETDESTGEVTTEPEPDPQPAAEQPSASGGRRRGW